MCTKKPLYGILATVCAVFELISLLVLLTAAFSFPVHMREAVPQGFWCRWHLLDQELGWLHNPDRHSLPQKMRYQVTTGNGEGGSWIYTVVFSVPLHLACLRAFARFKLRFLVSPSARDPNTHVPEVLRRV